jgi:hypothetical protein
MVGRRLEVLLGGHAVDDLGAREHVLDHAGVAHAFRIGRHHHDALLVFLERHPVVGFRVIALHVLQQVRRLDAVRLEGLVFDAEELGERAANPRQLT